MASYLSPSRVGDVAQRGIPFCLARALVLLPGQERFELRMNLDGGIGIRIRAGLAGAEPDRLRRG